MVNVFLFLGVDYNDRLREWDAVERLLHMLLFFFFFPPSAKIFFSLFRTDVTFVLKPLLVSGFSFCGFLLRNSNQA